MFATLFRSRREPKWRYVCQRREVCGVPDSRCAQRSLEPSAHRDATGVGMRWSADGVNHLLHRRLAWLNGRCEALGGLTLSPHQALRPLPVPRVETTCGDGADAHRSRRGGRARRSPETTARRPSRGTRYTGCRPGAARPSQERRAHTASPLPASGAGFPARSRHGAGPMDNRGRSRGRGACRP